MTKKDLVIIADYTETAPLTFDELCEICGISPNFIQELIDYQIVEPQTINEHLAFDLIQLKRVQKTLRLQRDLNINLAGVALVLDLLDELEQARARAKLLEKHFMK